MAILHNGMLSGKLGQHIYKIRNGKNYVCRAPKKRTKASSEQLFQQQKFAAVSVFAKRFRDQVKFGYASLGGKGFGQFIKHLHQIANYSNGQWHFNPYALQLSKGTLKLPKVKILFEEGLLTLAWPLGSLKGGKTLVLVTDDGRSVKHDLINATTHSSAFPFKGGHVFLFTLSGSGQQSSNTRYLGEFAAHEVIHP